MANHQSYSCTYTTQRNKCTQGIPLTKMQFKQRRQKAKGLESKNTAGVVMFS